MFDCLFYLLVRQKDEDKELRNLSFSEKLGEPREANGAQVSF
jgi:hypothetical protein